MGLFDKLTGEFIDIIEWTDNTNDTIVYRFPRYQNEIKMGAKLTVRESQSAVFINEGKMADVFKPGMYELSTQNMPIMTTLRGWKYGFNSPFKAEVYFVNTKQFVDQKWGTQSPITVDDERFGMIELRMRGTYAFRVMDAAKFLKEVSGTDGSFTTEEVAGQLRSLIISKFSDAVAEGNIPVEKFAANLDELAKIGMDRLNTDFTEYGLTITKFLVENVSMPDELKKEIFEYSRLNKIDMQKLAQMKAAKSIEKAAENQGTMGGGMGMGMGFGMANMMTGMFGQNMMQNQQQQNQSNQTAPPPIPHDVQYYVAVNGQQTGPFNTQSLMQLKQAGQFQPNTLVWKQGMTAWLQASQIPELASVFTSVPPPIPPVA